ncbi:MAG: 23S rRNA (guanosine(2251)-2'-O)-methyltransferase RlmB [Bacteroidales bacterium]|nr:23S rRNA (guanosine(2251)-2'-O)-methyltransferase RlmB [Bacteroidales bacterium]
MAKDNFIFGTRAVIEAVNSDKQIEKVLVTRSNDNELQKELLQVLKKHKILFQFVPIQKINKITRKNHQGVLAFISPVNFYNIEEIVTRVFEEGRTPFVIVLDGVTDVRNFGAIVRTAECAGADAVLVPEKGSAQINADAVKTSAGALHKVPICRTPSLRKTLENLKNSGLKVVTASEKAEHNYYKTDFKVPLLIVVGAEDAGVSKSIISLSDEFVKIPVLGEIKSLNVSVAASILMYETIKQRIN